jgi:8-oxo-dGTP pyrophosphatase MutT (NUDIX family)
VTELSSNPVEVDLHCPECDYNLTGAPGDRCPWCGWEIDVDVLVTMKAEAGHARRLGLAVTALLVGVGSLVALASLMRHHRGLSLWDALAVLAVLTAAGGHLALGVQALLSAGHWPMRPRSLAEILRFAGYLSIVLAMLGARNVFDAVPTPRVVRGVQVNGVLEYSVLAMLLAMPGGALLVLRLVAFRPPGSSLAGAGAGRRGARATDDSCAAPFAAEFAQRYAKNHLTQNWNPAPRPTTPVIEECIGRVWETELALAREGERMLHNGDLIRLVRSRATPTELHLELGPTCYRDFLGTNLHNTATVLRIGEDHLSNPVGISSTVMTRDGFLVFGRRGSRVAFHAGHLHTFGGLLEPSDRDADGRLDVFAAAVRELCEELRVSGDEIAEVVVAGLVRDRMILQPELLFEATLTLTRAALTARFDPASPDQEHTGWEIVHDEPEAIVPFLRRSVPVAPVAAAAMLLHGRHCWGRDWYEQSCYVLFGELPPDHVAHRPSHGTVPILIQRV